MKTILLTLGDASGIGPEVLVKCLATVASIPGIRPVVVGEIEILRDTASSLGLPTRFAEQGTESNGEVAVHSLGLLKSGDYVIGKLSAACGDAAFRYFTYAIEECLAGRADAIVTAPLNKEAMNLGGHAFVGHTDILEQRTGVAGPVMALWHPNIVVGHVTDHLPLRQALDAITGERVAQVVHLTHDALVKAGIHPSGTGPHAKPRIALAGINPHAGENGLLGREEIEILRPVIASLQAEGLEVSGPYPGDTVFSQALRGRFEAVIAMYHDQGFGPMKTLDMANGVNCTLGLPFVRTSPDHGTAFEIAGQNVAEPESMIAAYLLAVKLLK